MPHRFTHVIELFLGSVLVICTASAQLLSGAAKLAVIAQAGDDAAFQDAQLQYNYIQWLLLPLIGSLLGVIGCVYFTPPERRREVPGRGIVGTSFGFLLPQVIFFFLAKFESLRGLSLVPHVIILMGLIISILFFGFSKPFVEQWIRRSDNLAGRTIDRIDDKIPKS